MRDDEKGSIRVEDSNRRIIILTVNRPLKIGLRLLAGFSVVVVATVVVCLDTVDTRPYFKESYYSETTARFRASATTNRLAHGELSAGFGSTRLTPVLNATEDSPSEGKFRSMPLAGYGNRKGKPATGVHDDVFVKALALKVGNRLGVMVGADALIIPPEVTEMAVKRLSIESGLSREQIYLGATHTHASLGGWGEGKVAEAFSGEFQPGARVWFSECIVMAVQNALSDLKPALFGHGHFSAPEFIRNRLVGELGSVDPEFSFGVVRQDGGKTAVLGVFGAHATILSAGNMEFSGDYPGYWQRAMEKATGGVALFLAGGVGSHSPVSGGKSFEGAEKMGEALAQKLVAILPETRLTNQVTLGLIGLDITLPPFNVRLSDSARLRPWLAERLLHSDRRTFLQVFRINDSIWISSPCDFSGELALGIKDSLAVHGMKASVTSFNGDYVGYVIPSRYYHLGGYEPQLMSFYGPNVPDYFEEMMRRLAQVVIGN